MAVSKIAGVTGKGMHRFTTAVVLFHRALADRLGLGPTDHKCLDILRQRGGLTGSELAKITGVTTGAITGVVSRLEAAGYVARTADGRDARRMILKVTERVSEIHAAFDPVRRDFAELLGTFSRTEVGAIERFLNEGTGVLYRHLALFRGGPADPGRSPTDSNRGSRGRPSSIRSRTLRRKRR